MLTKFKILSVVALGLCWMGAGNTCFAFDCNAAYTRCLNENSCQAFVLPDGKFYDGWWNKKQDAYWNCCPEHPQNDGTKCAQAWCSNGATQCSKDSGS